MLTRVALEKHDLCALYVCERNVCRELVNDPSIVKGRSVLEIGAGTGLCGLVAARLGAAQARR